jgi:hypothetical protein
MERFDGVVPETPLDSADTDEDFPEEEKVDHAQSAPSDDEDAPSGPSVADAFRGGG